MTLASSSFCWFPRHPAGDDIAVANPDIEAALGLCHRGRLAARAEIAVTSVPSERLQCQISHHAGAQQQAFRLAVLGHVGEPAAIGGMDVAGGNSFP